MYKIIIGILALALPCLATAAARTALVIGNSDYQTDKLRNPVNDARDIARSLESMGFKVTQLLNADRRRMKTGIRAFTRNLGDDDDVGLFYYAGHGVQVNGQNYLVPIDADIDTESDVEFETINIARVLAGMEQAGNGLNLVILDACRNNPYKRSFRSAGRGLARMESSTSGSLIMYAAQPGQVARDGDGRNGLFTKHLLQAMDRPGLKAEEVFKQTALDVKGDTAGGQIPWIEGVIFGDFYFIDNRETAVTQPKTGTNSRQGELLFWESVRDSGDRAMLEAYLDQYSKGIYASLARIKLKQLNSTRDQGDKEYALTIKASPAGATVRILNIRPVYRPGMKLKPGRYHVSVSKPGYSTFNKWVTLSNSDLNMPVQLEKPGAGATGNGANITEDRRDEELFVRLRKKLYANKFSNKDVQDLLYLANKGYSRGQAQLAVAYINGTGVLDKDNDKALYWLRIAGNAGDVGSELALGVMYHEGLGRPQDSVKAYEHVRAAAEQGSALGQTGLGLYYMNGRGVAKNDAEAVKWFRKAAIQGISVAQQKLGYMYREGRGVVNDDAEAVKWLRMAADQENSRARVSLGFMFQNGRGVTRDSAEAYRLFHLAAEQGNTWGKYNIGVMYENGNGVVKNLDEAIKWYRSAADKNLDIAQYQLGKMYATGTGVKQNKLEAEKWYRKAAEQGHAEAKQALVSP